MRLLDLVGEHCPATGWHSIRSSLLRSTDVPWRGWSKRVEEELSSSGGQWVKSEGTTPGVLPESPRSCFLNILTSGIHSRDSTWIDVGKVPKNLAFKTESSSGDGGVQSHLKSAWSLSSPFSFTIPSEDMDHVEKVPAAPQWTWPALHLLMFVQGLSKSGTMERCLHRLSHLILTTNKWASCCFVETKVQRSEKMT